MDDGAKIRSNNIVTKVRYIQIRIGLCAFDLRGQDQKPSYQTKTRYRVEDMNRAVHQRFNLED